MALTDLVYSYDVDGQLTGIIDNLDPAKSLGISYDDLNRLVQIDQGVPGDVTLPIEDYAYDGEGNRLASHLSSLYSSNDHNQLLEDDSYTYAYDARGNRISRTAKATGAVETYSYDSQNRLAGYASGTTTASYAYDAMDRRIAKTVDGVMEAFVYDVWSLKRSIANDGVLEFSDAILKRRWIFGGNVDEPLAFEAYVGSTNGGSGTAYDLHAYRLGTVLRVVDGATDTVSADYSYDSFGTRTQVNGLSQRYGFTGREVDDETGLMYYRARHYDPELGQFLQRDPMGFGSGDLNLYAYAFNSPYKWTDPSGQTSTVSCARGSRNGGPCGSMAGFINPVVNGVLGLALTIEAALITTSVMNSEYTPENQDQLPLPPPTCNLIGHNYPSTAGPGQSTVPPTLFAQSAWLSILFVPGIGQPIPGNMNNDPRFCASNNWQKRQLDVTSARGERVVFHYQYNPDLGLSGRVADIKIVHYVPGF